MPDDTGSPLKLAHHEAMAPFASARDPGIEDNFDERTYVRDFPDVAGAIERGELASGLEHYLLAGRTERRLQSPDYIRQLARDRTGAAAGNTVAAGPQAPPATIEALVISQSGAIFLVGWSDDRHNNLVSISAGPVQSGARDWTQFCRLRRPDVEAVVQAASPYQHGFWVFAGPVGARSRRDRGVGEEWLIEFRFANGAMTSVRRVPAVQSDTELRDSVMSYFATSEYCGNRWVEAFTNLDRATGDALVAFNRGITTGITATATIERHGPQRKRYKGSIVVPLFGIADYLFLQACTYAGGPGIDDYEFIYVVNSPELIERLQREARIAEMLYGLSQTLVLLSGNVGFGAANNVTVQFARSSRLLCINPDVFPQQPNWAQRHTDLIASLPPDRVRLFGSTLCYDDGSLMHGGMYFDLDMGIHASQNNLIRRALLRVEHYGKGAPIWATEFAASRPVPAVTGAFISVDRPWFEKLGGFTEDYIFGHYEDADLCLKSLQAGTPAWLHDLRMWHLEGKGSQKQPQHEGGSLLNRWLFCRTWESAIVPDLLGRNPAHPLLQSRAPGPAAPGVPTIPPVVKAPVDPAAVRAARQARGRQARTAGR